MPKTRAEIDNLKRDWQRDGTWDLEETEGFEEHREELLAFRLEQEARWQRERRYTESPWRLWKGKKIGFIRIGEYGIRFEGTLLQATDAWIFVNITRTGDHEVTDP